MHRKGQVSFEALFLTLIILSSAMYLTQLYLQTNDVTVATVIARADLLAQVNSFEDNVSLSTVRIKAVDNGGVLEAQVIVRTTPSTFNQGNFDSGELEKTKDSIKEATRFEDVTFSINPAA